MTREEHEKIVDAVLDAYEDNKMGGKYEKAFNHGVKSAFNRVCKALEDIKKQQQPCDDCISREAVIEWLKDKDVIKMKYQEENARRGLASLPSVTPQRPKGKWTWKDRGGICTCRCSICGFGNWEMDFDFCPNCGAEMVGDEG